MGSEHTVESEEQMTTEENRGTVGFPIPTFINLDLERIMNDIRLLSDTEVWLLDELVNRKEPLVGDEREIISSHLKELINLLTSLQELCLTRKKHIDWYYTIVNQINAVIKKHNLYQVTELESLPTASIIIKIHAPQRFVLQPGKCASIVVNETIRIPKDAYGQFFIRKKHALEMINAPQCVFHSGWVGEPTIILMNLGNTIFEIKEGEELGEIVLLKGAL